MARVPLLLDTDVGDDVDDVFALLLAARCADVDLQGVTTVFGDAVARARIARKLLRLGGFDTPVVAGYRTTLAGRDPASTLVSGLGFADDEPAEPADDHVGAPDFLVEQIDRLSRSGGPLPTLVAIGPLTNVGAALRREPTIARKLGALVLMGGRVGPQAELGEHNVNQDPDATRIVLESGARLLIGTYEVTSRAHLDRADEARLNVSSDAACRAAGAMLGLYFQQRGRDWTSMYDPLSLTLAYSRRYLATRSVRLAGTFADRLSRFDVVDGAANAELSTDLDAGGFHEHLLGTIGAR